MSYEWVTTIIHSAAAGKAPAGPAGSLDDAVDDGGAEMKSNPSLGNGTLFGPDGYKSGSFSAGSKVESRRTPTPITWSAHTFAR